CCMCRCRWRLSLRYRLLLRWLLLLLLLLLLTSPLCGVCRATWRLSLRTRYRLSWLLFLKLRGRLARQARPRLLNSSCLPLHRWRERRPYDSRGRSKVRFTPCWARRCRRGLSPRASALVSDRDRVRRIIDDDGIMDVVENHVIGRRRSYVDRRPDPDRNGRIDRNWQH